MEMEKVKCDFLRNVKTEEISNCLGKQLNELRKKNEFCDFYLCTDKNELFPVHKIVLISTSEFFNVMFSNQNEGKTNDIIESFLIENVNKDNLEKIIEYMYTGNIEITSDNAKNIFKVSSTLNLENLMKCCVDIFCELININNCIEFWNLIKVYGSVCKKLEDYCIVFTMENAETILKSKQFIEEISIEQLKALISSEKEPCKEELIFSAVIDWINYDYDNRKSFLTELLKEIKTELISTGFLSILMQMLKEESLLNNTIFLEKVLNIINHNLKTIKLNENELHFCENIKNTIFTIKQGSIAQYSSVQKNFVVCSSIREHNHYVWSTAFPKNKSIFALDANGMYNFYSTIDRNWSTLTKLPTNSIFSNKTSTLSFCRAATLNDKIYISAIRENEFSIFEYQYVNGTLIHGKLLSMISVSPFPSYNNNFNNSNYGVCSFENNIYIFNGNERNIAFDTRSKIVNEFVTTDENIKRIVGFKNYIYGFSDTCIHIFDIQNNKWLKDKKKYTTNFLQTPYPCIKDDYIVLHGTVASTPLPSENNGDQSKTFGTIFSSNNGSSFGFSYNNAFTNKQQNVFSPYPIKNQEIYSNALQILNANNLDTYETIVMNSTYKAEEVFLF